MVPLGHYLDETGQSCFRVFAPDAAQLDLLLEGNDHPLPIVITSYSIHYTKLYDKHLDEP